MTHPPTFRALHEGWTLTAAELAPDAPEAVTASLAEGIPAVVPGEAHLDLLRAGLIKDPFDGDNEAAQQWIGDTAWRFSTVFEWNDDGSARYDCRSDDHYHIRDVRTGEIRDLHVPYDEQLLAKLDPELIDRLSRQGFEVLGYRLEVLGRFAKQAPRG